MNDDVVATFHSNGFVGPLNVISKEEAASALKEVRHELSIEGSSRFKLHLVLPFIDRIAHHPKLVSAVQQALGSENLLLWSSDINIKGANTTHYFEPHQDSAYAGLSPATNCLTAWVVGVVDGCLQFYPQSHKMGKLLHLKSQQNQNNLLSLGQYIDTDIIAKLQKPVWIPLRGGQATLHSFDTVHSSSPNESNKPRVGLALRYITQDVIQTKPNREMVTLISSTLLTTITARHDLEKQSSVGVAGNRTIDREAAIQYQSIQSITNVANFDMEPRLPTNPTDHDIKNGRKAQKEALVREESNYFTSSTTEKRSYA